MENGRRFKLGIIPVLALLVFGFNHTAFSQPVLFEDVAPQLGINDFSLCGAVFWYDVDDDGDMDLLRTSRFNTDSYLYQNNGDESFTRLEDIGLPVNWDAWTSTPMDFDHDGDLDIMIGAYHTDMQLLVNDGTNHYTDRWVQLGMEPIHGLRCMNWVDFNRDGWMDILLQTCFGWHLYENTNGHFADITAQTQLPGDDGGGFCEADIDLDGDIDMFSTYIGDMGTLWVNQDVGVFVDGTVAAGLGDIPASAGCVWLDVNHDKYPDLLTQNYGSHGIWLNDQDGTFTEMRVHGMETNFSVWPYGAIYAVADFDMDYDEDVYCCRAGGSGDNPAPNQFFRQDSINGLDIWFTDIAPELEMDFMDDGNASWSDYDGDGDLDLTLLSYSQNVNLFRNNTIHENNQLQVRILGPNGEQDRWHTRVEVYPHGSDQVLKVSELNTGNVNRNGFNNYFVLDHNGYYDLRIYFICGTTMLPQDYPQLSNVNPAQVNHLLTVRMGQHAEAAPKPSETPSEYRLDAAYPNPFNASTTIRFSLRERSSMSLNVYNLSGQLVTQLIEGNVDAGEHAVMWDASGQASGLYFVRMRTGDFTAQKKLVLLK